MFYYFDPGDMFRPASGIIIDSWQAGLQTYAETIQRSLRQAKRNTACFSRRQRRNKDVPPLSTACAGTAEQGSAGGAAAAAWQERWHRPVRQGCRF